MDSEPSSIVYHHKRLARPAHERRRIGRVAGSARQLAQLLLLALEQQ